MNTGPPWNITPGATSSWSNGHGLPQFPYPVDPAADYIITPERLQELWQAPRKVFLLLDNATPPEFFLRDATTVLTLPGKRLLVNHP